MQFTNDIYNDLKLLFDKLYRVSVYLHYHDYYSILSTNDEILLSILCTFCAKIATFQKTEDDVALNSMMYLMCIWLIYFLKLYLRHKKLLVKLNQLSKDQRIASIVDDYDKFLYEKKTMRDVTFVVNGDEISLLSKL